MLIASASKTVQLHEFATGHISATHEPQLKNNAPIRSISWSKDGNWLCVVPDTGVTEIVSIKSNNTKVIHLVQKVDRVTYASFQNSTKKYVAMGTANGDVLVYDIKNRNLKKQFTRLPSVVKHVEFTSNDTHIIASCENGDISLLSNVTNNLSCTLSVPKSNSCSALRTNPVKRNYFLAGSNEGIVAVWDINVNRCKYTTLAHNAPVSAVTFSPANADLILTAGLDRQFSFYDYTNKKLVAKIPVESNVTSVDFAPDGKTFVLGSRNGNLNLYDSRNIKQAYKVYTGHNSSVVQVLFQKNGRDEDCNISNTLPVDDKQIEHNCSEEDESIGVLVQNLPGLCVDSVAESNSKGSDSFLSALGIHNNTAETSSRNAAQTNNDSCKLTESNAIIETDANLIKSATPRGNFVSLHEKLAAQTAAASLCSTPITLSEQLNFKASPIVSQSMQKIELEEVTKTLKTEVKGLFEELKNDFSQKMFVQSNQLRRDCLAIHMSVIKGFMNTENDLNTLREYLSNETTEQLLAENAFLRSRVVELEQALALREN